MHKSQSTSLESTRHSKGRALRFGGVPAAVALMVVIAFALVGSAGAGTAKIAVAPANSSPPTISGTAQEGQMLTADKGGMDRHRADRLQLRVAGLQLGRRQLRDHQERGEHDLHGYEVGRRQHAPLRRHGQER